MMRRLSAFIVGAVLVLGFAAPALSQACPPVSALPDSERRTSYSPSASTGPFLVNFAILADGTDYSNWIAVWLNGVPLTGVTDWQLTIPAGTLATACRPITNASVTLTTAATGTLQIVGARRPRRTSQFTENQGVAARDLNRVITDIVATERETWDKINDATGRGFFAPPGQTGGIVSGPLSGVISGPSPSTDNAISRWNGTSGGALQDSGVIIDDSNNITGARSLALTAGPITFSSGGTDRVSLSWGTENVLVFAGQGNSKTAAIHLNPGSGTVPTGTIAEFVLQRTADQAFGGNYGRWSFTALGTSLNNASGLYGEYGGTVTPGPFIMQIGIENPVSTFTTYEYLRFQTTNGGAEDAQIGAILFGANQPSPGTQQNRIVLIKPNIGSAGTRDSDAILWEGKANDGTERAVWWRQYVDVTSNAGASSFVWERNLNGVGWSNALTLTSANILVSGATSALSTFVSDAAGAVVPRIQVLDLDSAASIGIARFSADTGPSRLILGKSRGATVGSYTIGVNADSIGSIIFNSSDGVDFAPAASIRVEIDGTPGSNDMPGRIVFATTLDGANTTTDRLVISNDGSHVGTTSSANALTVGRQGSTNPAFNVNAATGSSVTGLNVTAAAAAGGLAMAVTSSGTNENLTIDAKGSGTVTVNNTGTGNVNLGRTTVVSSATANNVTISGAAAAGRPQILVSGSDTDINLDITAKGTGVIQFNGRGSNAGGIVRFVSGTASNSNGVFFTSAAAGSPPTIQCADLGGTGDTNIDCSITVTGTGKVSVQNDLKTGTTTVGSLPTCNAARRGSHYFVTDSNAASYTAGIGAVVAAGGATNVPVVCDGTNWRIG